MTLTLNIAARNGIGNSGLNTTFASGRVRGYSGSKPATANLAPTGTLLFDITLPATPFAAGASGVFAQNGTWEDASADGGAATAVGYMRISGAGDDGSLDGNFPRIDAVGGGVDFTANGVVTAGQPVQVTSFQLTLPAGS